MTQPVWIFKSWCTTNEVYTHHNNKFTPIFASSVNGRLVLLLGNKSHNIALSSHPNMDIELKWSGRPPPCRWISSLTSRVTSVVPHFEKHASAIFRKPFTCLHISQVNKVVRCCCDQCIYNLLFKTFHYLISVCVHGDFHFPWGWEIYFYYQGSVCLTI